MCVRQNDGILVRSGLIFVLPENRVDVFSPIMQGLPIGVIFFPKNEDHCQIKTFCLFACSNQPLCIQSQPETDSSIPRPWTAGLNSNPQPLFKKIVSGKKKLTILPAFRVIAVCVCVCVPLQSSLLLTSLCKVQPNSWYCFLCLSFMAKCDPLRHFVQ